MNFRDAMRIHAGMRGAPAQQDQEFIQGIEGILEADGFLNAVNPPLPRTQPKVIKPGRIGRNLSLEEANAYYMLRRSATADGNALANWPAASANPVGASLLGGGIVQVQKIPTIDKPPSGQPYNYMTNTAIVVPAIGLSQVVVQFTVPPRRNGTIEAIANQIVGGNFVEWQGDIYWQLQADGQPIQGFNKIGGTLGTTDSPAYLGHSPIAIYAGQLIQLVLFNVSLIANQVPVGGLLRGHFYPIEQEPPGGASWL